MRAVCVCCASAYVCVCCACAYVCVRKGGGVDNFLDYIICKERYL